MEAFPHNFFTRSKDTTSKNCFPLLWTGGDEITWDKKGINKHLPASGQW